MNKKHLYVGSFAVVLAIITYGDLRTCQELPWPPRFMATGLVFGILAALGDAIGDLAPVVAVGLVLAALINRGFRQPDCNARLAAATVQPSSYQVVDYAPLPVVTPPPASGPPGRPGTTLA